MSNFTESWLIGIFVLLTVASALSLILLCIIIAISYLEGKPPKKKKVRVITYTD